MNVKLISWVLRIIAAFLLLQTLYFKFTAHPDSVYIFTKLGLEPYGRIGIGLLELIIALMIIIPRTQAIGSLLGLGIISGAIFSHISQLGVVVNGDGDQLFYLAIIVFVCCLANLVIHRKELPWVGHKL